MDTVDRIRLLVAPLLVEAEVELYDLEYTGGVLKITVDRTGGVDIGTIGTLTRAVSRLLDDTDPIASAFTLEVSSPGLERTLRTPEHFAGAVGEQVAIKVRAGVEGDRRVKGTLASADAEGITVAPAGAAEGDARLLTYDQVDKARTVFEWGAAPKPGGAKASGTSPSPSVKKKATRS